MVQGQEINADQSTGYVEADREDYKLFIKIARMIVSKYIIVKSEFIEYVPLLTQVQVIDVKRPDEPGIIIFRIFTNNDDTPLLHMKVRETSPRSDKFSLEYLGTDLI
ncbi:hypothetical protein RF11_07991 [Thelohanellus kitauei]|uniref:Uncharacterized protein n=1 Tax=Thelohanellus kitauei TaxID=669202 RepID=A0A0C2JL08_THEKT|nr:hypothetical protein RF11_07991 [Thelohanellus kitauei]